MALSFDYGQGDDEGTFVHRGVKLPNRYHRDNAVFSHLKLDALCVGTCTIGSTCETHCGRYAAFGHHCKLGGVRSVRGTFPDPNTPNAPKRLPVVTDDDAALLVSALTSIKTGSGAHEFSNLLTYYLSHFPYSHPLGSSLSLTHLRLQTKEPTRCVSQTSYSHSLLPSRLSRLALWINEWPPRSRMSAAVCSSMNDSKGRRSAPSAWLARPHKSMASRCSASATNSSSTAKELGTCSR
jgi:hypothetical protein